jgi:alpha-beta hydrolase superfamily lysophospholipase
MLMALVLVACGGSDSPPPTSEPQGVAVLDPTAGSTATGMATASAVIASTSTPPDVTATLEPTTIPTATPEPTAIPTASATVMPSATATGTSTPTAIPTATPMHPLSVELMRQGEYPGSEIVIEQTLEPGVNYNRYIASYQSEGLKIYALLTVPFGEKPESGWPVVVFNHGYIPPEQYRTTERYVAYVDGFARNGYIVFRSDYRGHGSSEGEARGSYGRPDYTIDVLNAVAAIKNYPDADPERIGMWGHSMGGHITLRSMVVNDDIKAGVIWAGVVASYPDLFERWRRRSGGNSTPTPDPDNPRRRWRTDLLETYGSPDENPEFYASISANTFVEDLSGPVQLHHGTADSSVPIEFSALLFEQIQTVGGVVEYYAYEGDDHNIANSFGTAMQRSIAFFDTYVKGIVP